MTDRNYWQQEHNRLKSILNVRQKCQELPLVIVLPKPANQQVSCSDLVDLLSLDSFFENGSLGDVELLTIDLERKVREGVNIRDKAVTEKASIQVKI